MYIFANILISRVQSQSTVYLHNPSTVQLAGAVVYTDSISAEGQDLYNECPGYDTKQSDREL